MASKEKISIGLDIGNYSIKYVKLASGKGVSGYRLLDFGVHQLSGSGSTGRLAQELNAVGASLSEKSVNVSISGPSVVVRYILLPTMKKEELDSSMQFEAEKYIPFNINEVMLDHQILEPNVGGKMRVLLVAAKRDVVEERIKLIQQARMTVNIIDVDSFALINAFVLNNPDDPDSDTIKALLNIGENVSSVNIIKHGLSYFTRDFPIGGREITKAICDRLGMDAVRARGLKHTPGSSGQEVMEATKPVLMSILDEVRLSLSYYENQFGSGADEVYLSGGSVNQQGFSQLFTDTLGLNCQLWDPAKALTLAKDISQVELDKVKHELPVAIGLALRE